MQKKTVASVIMAAIALAFPLVLIGANGAGKSTTLRTISSLLKPMSGGIEFEGVRLDRLPPNKIIEHGVVHVPEGRRLFPDMTVEDHNTGPTCLKTAASP